MAGGREGSTADLHAPRGFSPSSIAENIRGAQRRILPSAHSFTPNVEENKALNSYVGHGTERLDVPEAILIGGMRSADERPARLRAVPAGFDPEPGRFRGV